MYCTSSEHNFLARCDERINACLQGTKVSRVLFADNYHVVAKPVELQQRDSFVGVVLDILHACSKGHRFTHELAEVDTLQ